MHNIRPAEAFDLARKAQNVLHLPCLLKKTPIEWVKKYTFWPFDETKIFLARHEILVVHTCIVVFSGYSVKKLQNLVLILGVSQLLKAFALKILLT